ncbi:transposase IS66 [Desulfotomaculum nigrificans CO-1-SRB]|uniref:Transposase IS66 n=2 Tax=Desulfotomaculum nigrificans TaxID=1565 RepID=F6B884_DESCC|nr:transposase IS66 [Desulfotomaculum nigrificans CO-1-SRB]
MSKYKGMNNIVNNTQSLEELQKLCALQQKQIAELTAKLNWFEEQFRLSKQRQFGASSEKTASEQQQLLLFNEAEKEAQVLLAEPTLETITYKRRKQRGHREMMLKDLPVETIEYRLPVEEQICSCCGGPLHEMSTEVRQELKVIPAQVKIIKHVSHVYACRRCERENITTPITTAPMPKPVLPGSLVSPSTMAFVMSQKYVQGLPLYRQEQELARIGIEISRQTLANWMLYGANRWLTLLYDRMHQHLLKQDILHADETVLQVLHEPGRDAEAKSYLWLYRTGRMGPHIVLYEYQPTREGEHPSRFLNGFKGFLHVDGYSGYNKVPDVILVGCWAHARRKFDEALKALPQSKRSANVAAKEGLEFCNRLFAIERELKDATPEERYKTRLARSRPVLDAFWAWLNEQNSQVLPKSTFGKAIHYCLSQWNKLEAFLQDGRLEIDNNRSERSIKPFVIGRKNWLFANTQRGARASAVIYSIVETAKENGLNPFNYLSYIFEKLPNSNINDPNVLDKFLPWSDTLPANCRVHK